VLREALARGADRAIHVEEDRLGSINTDSFVIADALAGAVRDERFDLLLTGLQSDDLGAAQTGVILAERLGLPHATIVMDVQVPPDQRSLRVKRELEGGWFQWVSLPLPALLTIQSGINQLRYATLKGIMAAKKKEIRKVTPVSLPSPRVSIVGLDVPRKSKQTEMISGSATDAAAQLVQKLRDDARVLA
jgi:electron transfer flavoprotein beta subunit